MTRTFYARARRLPSTPRAGRRSPRSRAGSCRRAPEALRGERLEGRAVLAAFAYDAILDLVSVTLADG